MMTAAVAAMMIACGASARAQEVAREQSIKAAFIYKFGEFVTWPAASWTVGDFHICTLGDPGIAALIAQLAETERVSGRHVVARSLESTRDSNRCHVVFISASASIAAADRQGLLHKPILIVTDTGRPATEPAMIHFVIREDRVRFSIDDRLAADSGLAISSKLLSVALSVRRRQPER